MRCTALVEADWTAGHSVDITCGPTQVNVDSDVIFTGSDLKNVSC